MKKLAGILVTLALLAGAYGASAWYLGKFVESTIDEQYSNLLATQPYFKITNRDYQRGILESEETVTLSITGLPNSLDSLKSLDPPDETELETPIELTFHTRIQHGPFPGFAGLGAAISDTELVLPEEAKAKITEVMGDKPPFTQHNEIHFDGSGSSSFSSPSFDLTVPGEETGDLNIAWQGLNGKIDYAPKFQSFTFQMLAPNLRFRDSKQGEITVSNIVFDSDQKRLFDDLPLVYSGKARFSIGELAFNPNNDQPAVNLKQLDYEIEEPLSDEYIDVVARFGMQSLKIDAESIGPVHLDLSLRHIQARALAEIYQEFLSLYSNPEMFNTPPEELMPMLQGKLLPHAETIVANDPQLSFDRVSFSNADGEAKLAVHVKLNGAQLQELFNPMMLMAKTEANGDLSLSEKMILQLLRNPPFADKMQNAELTAEEIAARGEATAAQFQAQVAMLSEQGYLTRENDLLKTSMNFKGGQLTVNGKPFNPSAMAGPPPQP